MKLGLEFQMTNLYFLYACKRHQLKKSYDDDESTGADHLFLNSDIFGDNHEEHPKLTIFIKYVFKNSKH